MTDVIFSVLSGALQLSHGEAVNTVLVFIQHNCEKPWEPLSWGNDVEESNEWGWLTHTWAGSCGACLYKGISKPRSKFFKGL